MYHLSDRDLSRKPTSTQPAMLIRKDMGALSWLHAAARPPAIRLIALTKGENACETYIQLCCLLASLPCLRAENK